MGDDPGAHRVTPAIHSGSAHIEDSIHSGDDADSFKREVHLF